MSIGLGLSGSRTPLFPGSNLLAIATLGSLLAVHAEVNASRQDSIIQIDITGFWCL